MEPGLRGCPLAGVSGLFTLLYECFISWVRFWNAEPRPPSVPVKPGSLGVPAAPSGRKLLGLVQDGCLLADKQGKQGQQLLRVDGRASVVCRVNRL